MINKWDSFIKNHLLAEGLKKGSIHSLDGQVLATSHNFPITAQEARSVLLCLSENCPATFSLAGIDYTVKKSYSHFIHGESDRGGCVLARSKQALIVAIHDEKTHQTAAALLVTRLAQHLDECDDRVLNYCS